MNISSFYINKQYKLFENILLIFILSILTYFLIFSNSNFKIMTEIVNIFINIIIPSLFPFILFSNILTFSGAFNIIAESKICMIIKNIFRCSTHCASAILFGFLFGYPNGARYVINLYGENKISYDEAEYLLLFINNASPTYILSSIGIGMMQNISIGIILLVSHIISSCIVGLLYRKKYKFKKQNEINCHTSEINFSFDIIYKSISKTFIVLSIILGFMVICIFMYNYIITIVSYIFPLNSFIQSAFLCLIEISSGLQKFCLTTISLNTMLSIISFFLGFSSLSIIFQIFYCIYLNNFKLKNILKGKFFQGIISSIITYILVNLPFAYDKICVSKEVLYNLYDHTNNTISQFNGYHVTAITITLYIFFFSIFIAKNKQLSLNT